MKVKELKAALKDLGLSTKGKKAELEARLAEAELPEEEEEVIEEEIVEEVVEEELMEEIAEEEQTKEDEVVDLGKGASLVNGAYTVEKRPDRASTRWVKEVYGKKPNGGYVHMYTGDHYDGEGKKLEPKE
tara:strand:+ start:4 stop:393 length:390 start_codon:yes stop_codon:yes gene_type:complete